MNLDKRIISLLKTIVIGIVVIVTVILTKDVFIPYEKEHVIKISEQTDINLDKIERYMETLSEHKVTIEKNIYHNVVLPVEDSILFSSNDTLSYWRVNIKDRHNNEYSFCVRLITPYFHENNTIKLIEDYMNSNYSKGVSYRERISIEEFINSKDILYEK